MRAFTLTLTVLLAPTLGAAEPELIYPRIKGHGGVVPLPRAAQQARGGTKVVVDITADGKSAEVHRGLERVARLLNLYAAAGVAPDQVQVALVLHGEATRVALSDQAHAARFGTKGNPSLTLARRLKEAGVELYVCGQALHYKKLPAAEVADVFQVAQAALTVVINKQQEGHAYVPVP